MGRPRDRESDRLASDKHARPQWIGKQAIVGRTRLRQSTLVAAIPRTSYLPQTAASPPTPPPGEIRRSLSAVSVIYWRCSP